MNKAPSQRGAKQIKQSIKAEENVQKTESHRKTKIPTLKPKQNDTPKDEEFQKRKPKDVPANKLGELKEKIKKPEKLEKDIKATKPVINKIESQAVVNSSKEHAKKDDEIMTLKIKMGFLEKQNVGLKKEMFTKTLQKDDVKASKPENCSVIEKKLLCTEKLIREKHNDLDTKNKITKKLECDLKTLSSEVKQKKVNNIDDVKAKEYLKQISELNRTISTLENEKVKMKKTIALLTENSAHVADNQMVMLQKKLDEYKKLLESSNKEKLETLHKSESKKRLEIEKLKIQVGNAATTIDKQQMQLDNYEMMFDFHKHIKSCLQSNEPNLRNEMEELFVQMLEKNSTVSDLNNALSTKIEAYRELCEAISCKQTEMAQQDQEIKQLKEVIERFNLLRSKQEKKINRLEEEGKHLKDTIKLYQKYCHF